MRFRSKKREALYRERIRTLGAQLDVGRTLSAAIRNQFSAEAVGQYT